MDYSDDKDIIKIGIQLAESYHTHKENMSYTIFGLEGAFFIGIFTFGKWPPSMMQIPSHILTFILVVTWILFHILLRFQLRNRRIAAIEYAAYHDTLMNRLTLTSADRPQNYMPAHPVARFVDSFILPIRKAIREKDVSSQLAEGEIRPRPLASYHYFLATRMKTLDNRSSINMYGQPAERICTFGSAALLCITIYRVGWLTSVCG